MSSGLTNKQKKDWAKMLYLNEHITQKEIAERVNVNKMTIGKWVKEGKWEEMKTAVSITKTTFGVENRQNG